MAEHKPTSIAALSCNPNPNGEASGVTLTGRSKLTIGNKRSTNGSEDSVTTGGYGRVNITLQDDASARINAGDEASSTESSSEFAKELAKILPSLPSQEISKLQSNLANQFGAYSVADVQEVPMEELEELNFLVGVQKKRFITHFKELREKNNKRRAEDASSPANIAGKPDEPQLKEIDEGLNNLVLNNVRNRVNLNELHSKNDPTCKPEEDLSEE